jgi:predicted HicB family RNase H-like nuclease
MAQRSGSTMRQVVLQMPPELHEEIKSRAAEEDLSMAQAIRRAIRNYLAAATTTPPAQA